MKQQVKIHHMNMLHLKTQRNRQKIIMLHCYTLNIAVISTGRLKIKLMIIKHTSLRR
ncbi:hypothetical protein A1OE_1381 [Candidatus Endolissoclinum faulkneri L2]|uniref:Uncharacterized protein n=1 Tax=Candidatus Endolissoclinum faulkneri L2 TaxID=1193729 RepID=K7YIV6_9PROT|nr:hypothetical protein A1OE_1381 [Candidatus Endolissoclinum faulkneri L2]